MLNKKEIINLGVRVIVIQNNEILIVKQRKPNGRDVYVLPGGSVNPNEDIFSAAKREVWEETCLKIKTIKLVYLKELFGPNLHSFEFYILGRIIGGCLNLGCDPELPKNSQILITVKFVPLKNLGKLNFYPRELRTKLIRDKQRGFKNINIYLGTQRFTEKQFKRLFGKK